MEIINSNNNINIFKVKILISLNMEIIYRSINSKLNWIPFKIQVIVQKTPNLFKNSSLILWVEQAHNLSTWLISILFREV